MTASPARVPGITRIVPARRRELELLGCDALIEPVVIEVGDAAMLQVRHDGRIPTKAHTDCQSRSNLPRVHNIQRDVLRRGVKTIFARLNHLRQFACQQIA